ncbi:MAG TPA: TMEM175 family protein [Actinomycetota bacterium]|nr:TMEM175 family protein [Actinomycetota bacterium]
MAPPDDHPAPTTPSRSSWTYARGGLPFDRVAFFTDAVFAIAMTLLVVSLEAPALDVATQDDPASMVDALRDYGPQIFSFFVAFLLLGRYWMAHHAFVATLGRIDRRFIALNLAYLAFVAFLPFPTLLIGRYEANPISVVLFAITLAVISGMEAVTFRHAHRAGLLTRPVSEATYRYGMVQSLTPVALFVVSIPIAFWSPTAALLTWLLTVPLGIWTDRRFAEGAAGWQEAAAPPPTDPP